MPLRIEDYALIGDTQTAALVGIDGGIDWLCWPRFDSGATFASLLGGDRFGHWRIRPVEQPRSERRYRGNSLVLETTHRTDSGEVRVIDLMPPRGRAPDVIRVVEGVRGEVRVHSDLVPRFDYGSVVPWIPHTPDHLVAIGGPDAIVLRSDVPCRSEDARLVADFTVRPGDRVSFVLTWFPSWERPPEAVDALEAVAATQRWWEDWVSRCTDQGPYRDIVLRSLITLKAMTYAPTGGIVAAPTTSLPEKLGGARNWDYRFCWLRDATFTLYALLISGYGDEARAWRDWLLRAVAGDPSQLQMMYGPAGERRLTELELPWLPGYEGSAPVRIGNGARSQIQLDVIGEVMDTMHIARRSGLEPHPASWDLQQALLHGLERMWREPDEGIWEVRGPRRHFTHSKMMAWVGVDRAVKAVERFGLDGPVERWRDLRRTIREDVLRHGYSEERGAFVQYYGSSRLDASLLMMPLVGFLPADDPRVVGTVDAIRRELCTDGFVHRYAPEATQELDGLPPGEGTFLLCSFWLADNLTLRGDIAGAREIFERVIDVRNDVGLLSEEYDLETRRLVGNFPQALTHVGLVNTARNLSRHGPAERRPNEEAA